MHALLQITQIARTNQEKAHCHRSDDHVSNLIRVAKWLTVLEASFEALSIDAYKMYQCDPTDPYSSEKNSQNVKHQVIPLDYSYCFQSNQHQMMGMNRQQPAQRLPEKTISRPAKKNVWFNPQLRDYSSKTEKMEQQIITLRTSA
jgi:hypothetical protein